MLVTGICGWTPNSALGAILTCVSRGRSFSSFRPSFVGTAGFWLTLNTTALIQG